MHSWNPTLFKADEVAKWIEHSNVSKMLESVDDNEKIKLEVGTLTNGYSAWFLTEDGLYEVLMQSRKPIAKKFKKKVKEILKDVRKYGMYATDELLDNPDLIIKMATKLKEEKAKNKELEDKMKEDKPKVLFAEAVSIAKNTILVREMAKLIKQNGVDMGEKRLFIWLRENGYLIKKIGTDYNMPTQRSMDLGLFEIKETPVLHSSGEIEISKTPKITGKGQQYFLNIFLKDKIA
ncbi:antirepressor [Fusobacterium animalis]|uniref:Antirepressor n=1 Tax=Fusobacterium animalis TaxID=76859 RepID=A0A0M5M5V9_9FUSO|nr:antirepressor [Fusobacterium animalis]